VISGLEHAQHTLLFNSGISTISAVLSVLKAGTAIMV
jgi:cystathionine beta-lyase/cystathionine gamma-synthase